MICRATAPVVMLLLLLLPGGAGSCPTAAAAHPCGGSSSSSSSRSSSMQQPHTSAYGGSMIPLQHAHKQSCTVAEAPCYSCYCLSPTQALFSLSL
jgi:hypothetical protein